MVETFLYFPILFLHQQATGDLGTIDSKRGIFYYLGDSSLGTTLVGLSLKDGSMACSTAIPFREIGFVGFGACVYKAWSLRYYYTFRTRNAHCG